MTSDMQTLPRPALSFRLGPESGTLVGGHGVEEDNRTPAKAGPEGVAKVLYPSSLLVGEDGFIMGIDDNRGNYRYLGSCAHLPYKNIIRQRTCRTGAI